MVKKINIFVILRILIGSVFVISGFEKLIGPYQNFLYVIQSYAFLNVFWEEVAARVVPWLELFLGVFLIFGLWLGWVLRGLLVLVTAFIFVVTQALVRGLPIDECGCFGGLISFPPPVVLLLDSALLFLSALLLYRLDRTSSLSLDGYFQ